MHSHSLKIVLFGNSGSGKSSLLKRFLKDTYDHASTPTHAVDILTYEVEIDNTIWNVDFWDASGDERFVFARAPIEYMADCCVLVFDIAQVEAHATSSKWLSQVQDTAPHVPIICAVNKIDSDSLIVEHGVFEYMANSQIPCFVVSARTGGNVVRMMNEAIKLALDHKRNPPDVIENEFYQVIQAYS